MKNLLGILIVIGAAACQVADSPPPVESSTTSELSNGDICSGEPHYCKAVMPAAQWWTTMPQSTVNTVGFIDSKTSPGYWWVYGADPVLGKVLWVRLAVPTQQAGSVANGLATLPGGFLDYTRPPPCSICPGGDGWLGSHLLESARIKAGLSGQAMISTSACYP